MLFPNWKIIKISTQINENYKHLNKQNTVIIHPIKTPIQESWKQWIQVSICARKNQLLLKRISEDFNPKTVKGREIKWNKVTGEENRCYEKMLNK